jgi:glutamyl/glutaminyl-tRNA synthetase
VKADLITQAGYRGRLAPSPTGLLHLGHARTFWVAHQRARAANGTLILRNEDLDPQRSKPEFVAAFLEDLRWLGCEWQEGPDLGGPFAPYNQSERTPLYRAALEKLLAGGWIFPCTCSRKDLASASAAPHAADDELIYPGTCRSKGGDRLQVDGCKLGNRESQPVTFNLQPSTKVSWRFRVPDGEVVEFTDGQFGPQRFIA